MIWVFAGFVVLIWYLVVQFITFKKSSSTFTPSKLCPSPDCVRCSSAFKTLYCSDVGQKLKKMYEKYESLAVHKIEERLTFDETTLPEKRCPTICYFRNMCDEPWHSHKQKYLQNLLLDSYGVIKGEVVNVVGEKELWSVSDTNSTENWKKLFLFNQGKKIQKNCKLMPKTTALIEGLDTFMSGVIFGNAFISILDGHSFIEPHCGPTNLRVRCHMGLQVPQGDCSITVNGVREHWANQECLMFDDSFLHSASNKTDSQRIVLIVDLWHPNLTITEIKIFEELFAVRQ